MPRSAMRSACASGLSGGYWPFVLFSVPRGTAPAGSCALALLAQLFAVQLETVAGDLETALVQASGAAIAGRILFVITLIFETMAVVSHHFAARDRT